MALWSWRTLRDDSVEVDRGDGSGFQLATSLEHPQVIETQARVLQWRSLAADAAAKHGVPLSWILAIVFAESGGKADANNAPECGGTGCVGLMAVHWAVHGQSREDMLDPAKNLDYGASLLARSRKAGYDLPAAASIHVAGGGTTNSPHSGTCTSAMTNQAFPHGSPWGMCEHMFSSTQGDGAVGYIDRVVRANNSFVQLLAGSQGSDEPYDVSSAVAGQASATPGVSGAKLLALTAGGTLGYLSIQAMSKRLRYPR